MTTLIDRANTVEVVMVDAEIFHEFKTSVIANLATGNKELTRLVKFFDGNGKEGLPARLARLEQGLATHIDQHATIIKQIDDLDAKLDKLFEKMDALGLKSKTTIKDAWDSFGMGIKIGVIIGGVLASFFGITGLVEIIKAVLTGL